MCHGSYFDCPYCSEYFTNHARFREHCEDEHLHCPCHDIDFGTWRGLKEHYVQHSEHHYCQYCNKHFRYDDALLHHYDRYHYYCRKCSKVFFNSEGLKEHYVQSGKHSYCQYCDEHFECLDDFLDHGEDEHFICRSCARLYPTEARLTEHLQQDHHYCAPCKRFFQSASNLEQHLRSSTHQPRNFVCPANGCSRAFVSTSSLILHAESGTCKGGLTRRMVNEYVVRMDRNNIITNPSRLITGPSGVQAPLEREFKATERCWNGHAYECYLCHNEFAKLFSLNAHLNSPRHRDKIYRCPHSNCRLEYSVLSGLFQHVESGNCGVSRFQGVKDMMNTLNRGLRSLTM